MTKTLLYERDAHGVGVITFNRPEARNALNLATMRQFAELVAQLADDTLLRVLIVTGAGHEAFCSGGDLVELSAYPTADDGRMMITLMGNALLALERLPVPVIAAMNGYALGGGSEIALACDMRIVDERASLGLVHIHLGLTPGWGAGQRLLRLVGYARAMEILLRGRALKPDELQAFGLVNQIVPAGEALQYALDFAHEIAGRDADVVRAIKTLLQAGATQPYDDALHVERDVFPALWAGQAHLDAVRTFLEKRKP
ncbi:MAG: enoyl-CoA hydratase/isomerase family protein [Chloroflexi bacterium]|nr:MAG: enoyl-CoA hydratase/isomerase family protein [Chloroflexota bacterium]